MTIVAVLYLVALAGIGGGLAAGGGRYHGRVAAINALLLAVTGVALAVAQL